MILCCFLNDIVSEYEFVSEIFCVRHFNLEFIGLLKMRSLRPMIVNRALKNMNFSITKKAFSVGKRDAIILFLSKLLCSSGTL